MSFYDRSGASQINSLIDQAPDMMKRYQDNSADSFAGNQLMRLFDAGVIRYRNPFSNRSRDYYRLLRDVRSNPELFEVMSKQRFVHIEEIQFDDIKLGREAIEDHMSKNGTFVTLERGIFYHTKIFRASPLINHFRARHFGRLTDTFQFDLPGTNSTDVQRVWKVIESGGLTQGESIMMAAGFDVVEVARAEEQAFADFKRSYAIRYGLHDDGVRITEDAVSGIEFWGYNVGYGVRKMPDHFYPEDEEL
jgi:hypothetical protein